MIFIIVLFAMTHQILPAAMPANHEFYLSVIEVRRDFHHDSVTVSVKVFSDDLQNALRVEAPDHSAPALEEICNAQDAVRTYLGKHITILVNAQHIEMKFKACSREGDVHWMTFRGPCPAEWKTCHVRADYFMELFPAQLHIVQIFSGEEKRYIRLSKSNPGQLVSFAD